MDLVPHPLALTLLFQVDLVLHPLRSELNFPIGAKAPYDLGEARWLLPVHLLDLVFFSSNKRICAPGYASSPEAERLVAEVAAKVEEGYSSLALQRTPHLVLLSPHFYHTTLKPLSADWALEWLKLQASIPAAAGGTIRQYLVATGEQASALSEALQAAVPEEEGRSLINLARDWVS